MKNENMTEKNYSVEKSAINFIGEIGIIYNCENFSWKPLPFEFIGVSWKKDSFRRWLGWFLSLANFDKTNWPTNETL